MNPTRKRKIRRRPLRFEGLECRRLLTAAYGELTGDHYADWAADVPDFQDSDVIAIAEGGLLEADNQGEQPLSTGIASMAYDDFDDFDDLDDFDKPPFDLPDPRAPLPPTNFEITGQTGLSITLRWRDISTDELDFRLFRSDSVVRLVTSPDVEGTGGLVSYTDTIPSSGIYQYYVVAHNEYGNSFRVGPVSNHVAVPLVVPALSSRAGAPATLYLDFNGHHQTSFYGCTGTIVGELCGDTWDWVPGVTTYSHVSTPPFDRDGIVLDAFGLLDPFTDGELDAIRQIWNLVAEDFAPFDINVTTVNPGSFSNKEALRVAIGGDWMDWYGESARGLAFTGSFYNGGPNIVYAFAQNGSGTNYSLKSIADTVSQEAGHAFGLWHQSLYDSAGNRTDEYHPGDGSWGPIMGAGSPTLSTWHNGTSSVFYPVGSPIGVGGVGYSTTIIGSRFVVLQDDMVRIARSANGFGYRGDDHGNTLSDATPLMPMGPMVDKMVHLGVIEKADGVYSDEDVFSFTTGGGPIEVEVDVARYGWTIVANLDAKVELRDEDGNVLATSDPAGTLDAAISLDVDAGKYYVVVSSQGDYGRVGQYWVSVTAPTTLLVSTLVDELDTDYSAGDLSLREALLLAAGSTYGDTIQFDGWLAGGTITLDPSLGQLEIDSNVEIRGLGVEHLTIDADGNSRVFHVADGVTATVAGLTVTGGTTLTYTGGGGILNEGVLTIVNAAISGNKAEQGGGGGGVYNSGQLTINNTTISDNWAYFGGGIYDKYLLTLTNSTISGNNAVDDHPWSGGYGGGIYSQAFGGWSSIVNTTISDNSAVYDGGGVYDVTFSTSSGLSIFNSTIVENSAHDEGGGIYNGFNNIELRNTIVAHNTASSGSGRDLKGDFDSKGHNLISDAGGSTGWTSSDMLGSHPKLGPLEDNGGPTKTHALQPDSPAIDAGEGIALLPTDQRGWPRIIGGAFGAPAIVDIGAFEFDPRPDLIGVVVDGSVATTDTGTGTATGTVFVMYSQESVYNRFAENPPQPDNSYSLIVVKYIGGQWHYDDGSGYHSFTPRNSDVLIAALDFTNHTIVDLQGASGEDHGVAMGYASGDLTFLADRGNEVPNNGEFTVEGTYFVKNSTADSPTVSIAPTNNEMRVANDAVWAQLVGRESPTRERSLGKMAWLAEQDVSAKNLPSTVTVRSRAAAVDLLFS